MARRRRLLALMAIGAFLLPRRLLDRLPPLCPVRLATGYPCPTCGMTRSWHSFVRLDAAQAVRDHPIGPAVLAVIAIGAWEPTRIDDLAAAADRVPMRLKVTALVAWLGWWVSRLMATKRRRQRTADPASN